ncbi:ABC transporter permease [Pseudomonas abyssi]|uniref:ABC transporter permease n=1 Tax=Pseudomonas abyssi TaxID=170540 RepID=A0A395QZJ5_9PSED|nr:ABC transporter permease [Halopseudomonas gallaeciensis]RGP53284.1 ABC transporter permease [Halopseudomonas gallaeciensis]|tara:strand:- start:675 stop:1466 length:792 start_codon:yes stop_codon:yes gene_type:complete
MSQKPTDAAARRALLLNLSPWLFFVGLILLWELVCRVFELPTYVLPAPSEIGKAFFDVEFSRWMMHLWATLRVALMGFALSIVISIPLAIAMMRSEFLSRTLYPMLVVVQSTPVVAVAPLIIVMMGSDDPSRVLITCLLTFFPLVVSTATGINETPAELIELSRSLDAPTRRETWQIRIPYAIPHIFSGLKVAITLAIIGAVVAEFVAAEEGLGYFIQFSTSFFKIPQAFAGLFFLAIVSLLLFKSVQWTQQIFFAWSLPKKK